jgi:hypothetical protein
MNLLSSSIYKHLKTYLSIQFCIKKQNLTGYIQHYKKKMVGQTQRPWIRENPNVRQKKKGFYIFVV